MPLVPLHYYSMTEQWKPIPGFGNHYEASTLGRIRVKDRTVMRRTRWHENQPFFYKSRILQGSKSGVYLAVHIGLDRQKIVISVHRLVAMAFHGLPGEGKECCHNNGDPTDNRPVNLRWDTHLENNRDRKRHGNYPKGTDHPMSKFPTSLVDSIKNGETGVKDALNAGVSRTHYYRIKRSAS